MLCASFYTENSITYDSRRKITTFFAAPTCWNMLLQKDLAQYDLTSMKMVYTAEQAMAPG